MMKLIDNSRGCTGPEGFGADLPVSPQEAFVTDVYASMDEAIACELDRLRIEEGVIPSCKRGCYHCCQHHILTDMAEVHTLTQYVKREFSKDQINELKKRTQQWHAWDHSRPGRYLRVKVDEQVEFSDYVHFCPLLVDGACSVYPVRPVVCRVHLVSSHPRLCLAVHNRESTEADPAVLKSVSAVISPFSRAMEDHAQYKDLDYSRSIMLLPHGLAIEMGWSFAIEP